MAAMETIVVGLGNPGEEYEGTRHNAGRMALELFRKTHNFPEWAHEKKLHALISKGTLGKGKVTLVLPETYMNRSGSSIKPLITSLKKAERLIVAYDELDMPLGKIKLTFGRSSGGHRGVESIIRAIKTKEFLRVRIGISPQTPKGALKKPKGEEEVLAFLMKPFTPAEKKVFAKTLKQVAEAIETAVREGRASAMNAFN